MALLLAPAPTLCALSAGDYMMVTRRQDGEDLVMPVEVVDAVYLLTAVEHIFNFMSPDHDTPVSMLLDGFILITRDGRCAMVMGEARLEGCVHAGGGVALVRHGGTGEVEEEEVVPEGEVSTVRGRVLVRGSAAVLGDSLLVVEGCVKVF